MTAQQKQKIDKMNEAQLRASVSAWCHSHKTLADYAQHRLDEMDRVSPIAVMGDGVGEVD